MATSAQTWWAKSLLIGSVIAAVLLPLGALGYRFGVLPLMGGIGLLGLGAVLAAAGLFLGIIALVIAFRDDRETEKPSLYIGLAVCALVLGVMGMQYNTASSVPPIHNISTDTEDPPEFAAVVALRGDGTNPLVYDAEKLAGEQRKAYPFVKSLNSELSSADAFDAAVTVIEAMGLEIVDANAGAGRIEATATSFWFGFKDDVVVRIRAAGSGSVIDMRSVSRVGLSDLGVNARRIGEFLERFPH